MLSNYYDMSNGKFKEINHKSIATNKEQWCNWLSQNFQKLTDNSLKDLYCSNCGK